MNIGTPYVTGFAKMRVSYISFSLATLIYRIVELDEPEHKREKKRERDG